MPSKKKNRKPRESYADPERPSGTHLTLRERVRIITLSRFGQWNQSKIARYLGIARTTVRSCIVQGFETPKKPVGRLPMLNTPIRKRLVNRATLDAFHRRMPYEEIAQIEGIQACRRTLIKAFEKEQYHRRVATEKPLLTDAHKQARLQWAYTHLNWTDDMWARVIWTDEASFSTGGFGQVYVTRRPEEKYLDACCFPKFRGYSSWMIHGSISAIGKGPLVIFEKEWGSITGAVYREKVIPWIYDFRNWMEHHPRIGFMRSILMEDGASQHTAHATRDLHRWNGVIKMVWPANSPDLNPIENVWRLLKYRVGKRFPKTEAEVRQYIEEEWAKLSLEDFQKYISNMRERCQAVIDANGGHTKW